jgi:hypothetical protein
MEMDAANLLLSFNLFGTYIFPTSPQSLLLPSWMYSALSVEIQMRRYEEGRGEQIGITNEVVFYEYQLSTRTSERTTLKCSNCLVYLYKILAFSVSKQSSKETLSQSWFSS